mgnify:CR=1 FL=1
MTGQARRDAIIAWPSDLAERFGAPALLALRDEVEGAVVGGQFLAGRDVAGREDVESIVPDGAPDVVNRYPIAALKDARSPDAAAAFVEFVLGERGQAILADLQFGEGQFGRSKSGTP